MKAANFILIAIAALVLLSTVSLATAPSADQSNKVIVMELQQTIDPGTSAYFKSYLSSITPGSAAAVVIEINSQGGFISSMQEMLSFVTSAQNAGVPVYVYIDGGGFAFSASSYVAMASDILFMGPGSSIGYSAPIAGTGSQYSQVQLSNQMQVLMQSMAQAHGRNESAAVEMVRNNSAYTASQAIANGLVDGIAQNLSAFLSTEGLASGVSASNVDIVTPDVYDDFLSFLSDPFVDAILIGIGAIAILLDLYHASVILSVFGGILIGLGLIGAGVIGASVIGLIFVLVGAFLTLFEFKVGHGFMMLSGIILVVIGAFLFTPSYISYAPSSNAGPFSANNIYIAAAIIVIGLMVAYYLQYIIRSLAKRKQTGLEGMIGKEVDVKSDLVPEGWISFEGQQWKARLVSGERAQRGEKVIVKSNEGLTLLVEKKPEEKPEE